MDNGIPKVLFKYKSFDKYTADILRNSEAFFCPASRLDDQFESAISISKKILSNDLEGYIRELMPFIIERVAPSSSEVLKNEDMLSYFNNGKLNVPKFKNLILKHDSNVSHSQLDMLVNFINKLQNVQSNKKLSKALKKLMYVDLHNYLFNSDENWDYLSSHLFANDFKLIMQEYGNTFIQSALEESEDL